MMAAIAAQIYFRLRVNDRT